VSIGDSGFWFCNCDVSSFRNVSKFLPKVAADADAEPEAAEPPLV
jgi:hypothetical protein